MLVGLDKPPERKSLAVYRQGSHIVRKLRVPNLKLQPARSGAVAVDPAGVASEMEPEVEALGESLANLDRQRKAIDESLVAKDEAVEDLPGIRRRLRAAAGEAAQRRAHPGRRVRQRDVFARHGAPTRAPHGPADDVDEVRTALSLKRLEGVLVRFAAPGAGTSILAGATWFIRRQPWVARSSNPHAGLPDAQEQPPGVNCRRPKAEPNPEDTMTTIRAILENGAIRPLEELPQDGTKANPSASRRRDRR